MKIRELITESELEVSEISLDQCISCVATTPDEVSDRSLFILENSKKTPQKSSFKTLPVAIVADSRAKLPGDIPAVRVKNARAASAVIHSRFFGVDFNEIKLIGVTGTNGKTTTAYLIYSVLMNNNIKAGFIGTGRIEISGEKISSSEYSMTTPDPKKLYKVLKKMQDEGCKWVVMEVSSHALALDKVAAIPFDYGVFTNLSPEHTDFHSDMKDYFEAKMKLLRQSKNTILNIDDYHGREAAKVFENKRTTVGVLWPGDFYATNIETEGNSRLSYFLHTDKICYKTTLPLSGKYNVYNSLLASAVCIDIGIAPCLVKKALSTLSGIAGRFEVIKGAITVIIDYAHTEAAYESFLESMTDANPGRSITVVFGCGGERDRTKRPKIAAIVEKYADKIILTQDNSRNEDSEQIFNDVIKGFSKDKYLIIKDRKTAIRNAILNAEKDDVIAIVGKGAEEYNIDKNGYHPFCEKEIVTEALRSYENKA